MSYMEQYAASVDERVKVNPRKAVGGLWEEIGALQYEFLVKRGLTLQHSLLDYGCGTGRLAEQVIPMCALYVGVDISAEAVRVLNQRIGRMSGVYAKAYLDRQLNFSVLDTTFAHSRFNFIMVHSVFTHLPLKQIIAFFDKISSVMDEGTKLFFTYHPAEEFIQSNDTNFRYPFEMLAMAIPTEFKLRPLPYDHPRGQKMVEVTLR